MGVIVAIALSVLQSASGISTTDPSSGSLVRSSPSWYDSALATSVLAAGPGGLPGPSAELDPKLTYSGVRPGIWIISPNWCTANFIFSRTGGMDGGPYYIGTAKHCVQAQLPLDPNKPTEVTRFDPNENVIGKDVVMLVDRNGVPTQLRVGRVAYATSGADQIGNDYALVEIDPSLYGSISPSIAVIGGPTSVYSTPSSGALLQPDPAFMFGHGLVLGTGGTARAGAVTSFNASRPYGYGAVITAISGDSGAPLRTASGAAVGNITNVGTNSAFSPGIAFGTRVSLVTDLWGLHVVTCTSALPWPQPGCPPSS